MRVFFFGFIVLFTLYSCNDDVSPKPKSYLKLEYPEAIYKTYKSDCPYVFDISSSVQIEKPRVKSYCDINLSYPKLKGKIHITYHEVDEELLVEKLLDAQKITQKHAQVAEGIASTPFENKEYNRFGMVYEVEGDAASPVQFYVTDRKKHFMRGSVYFNAKPNYDSILPAAHYLKKDLLRLMETLEWKD
jgi:gliding motility-associated lipoprotein GldD